MAARREAKRGEGVLLYLYYLPEFAEQLMDVALVAEVLDEVGQVQSSGGRVDRGVLFPGEPVVQERWG